MASPIAQRITDAQERLNNLRDQLTEHLEAVDESKITDDQLAIRDELNTKIDTTQKSLESLQLAEKRLAQTSEQPALQPVGDSALTVRNARPFAVPAKKVEPVDYVWRSLTVALKHHIEGKRRPLTDVLKETYGEDEQTKAVMDVITRTATIPADTTTTGWAATLVQTSIGAFFEALIPYSVYPGLAAKGGSFTFGRNGIVVLPTRSSTPTLAGSFVAQGGAIPVRQGAFTSVSFTPKKMGTISSFTREIAEHSTPSIEALIRQAILQDTGVALDLILLDATVADTTRPAGLRAGVSGQTPTAGGGLTALIGDLKLLTGVLIAGTNGNIRAPVWIMNPADVQAAKLTPATAGGGEFPFKAELTGGTLLGYPVLQSTNMAQDMVMILDAADFVTATGDSPTFSVSDQATLHMETTPTAISTTTTAVAAPIRSLFQTDSQAVRMMLDVNWGLLRTGTVAWVTGITWAP